jgi:cytochrome b involved in lipid metabolism
VAKLNVKQCALSSTVIFFEEARSHVNGSVDLINFTLIHSTNGLTTMSEASARREAERGARSVRPHREWVQYVVDGKPLVDLASPSSLYLSPSAESNLSRTVTKEELSRHSSQSDVWISFDSVVYDVTNYLNYHPGGIKQIIAYAGKDATSAIKKAHSWVNVHSLLKPCLVGSLAKQTTEEVSSHLSSDAADSLAQSSNFAISPMKFQVIKDFLSFASFLRTYSPFENNDHFAGLQQSSVEDEFSTQIYNRLCLAVQDEVGIASWFSFLYRVCKSFASPSTTDGSGITRGNGLATDPLARISIHLVFVSSKDKSGLSQSCKNLLESLEKCSSTTNSKLSVIISCYSTLNMLLFANSGNGTEQMYRQFHLNDKEDGTEDGTHSLESLLRRSWGDCVKKPTIGTIAGWAGTCFFNSLVDSLARKFFFPAGNFVNISTDDGSSLTDSRTLS